MGFTFGHRSYVHGNAHGIVNTFDAEVRVGNWTSIAKVFTVLGGIAEHANVLNPNLVSTFPMKELLQWDWPACGNRGPIIIGSDVWIGANATVLDGVEIGDGAIIAAGSVVTRSIPPFAKAGGNPCHVFGWRFPQNIIARLLKIRWWDWPEEKIKQNLVLMQDVAAFVDVFTPADE